MQSSTKLLLDTLRLSSGLSNKRKYEKDPKKRKKIGSGYIGLIILYGMLIIYSFCIAAGIGYLKMYDIIPIICATTISLISFVTTLMKVNGYLFAFKDYDMLMSLPFTIKTVVASKFIYMYTKSLPWVLSITIPTLLGYIIHAPFSVMAIVYWLVLSFFLPVLPMVIAAILGTLFAKIGSLSRHKNLLQTILTFIFIILCFSLRFIIEDFFKPDTKDAAFASLNNSMNNAAKFLPNVGMFSDAIIKGKLSSALLLFSMSILIAELFFLVVSKFYKDINSRLMSSAAGKKYHVTTMKNHSILNSIAYKEFKRMTGSTVYITNAAFGELLVVILSIAVLFIDMDKIIGVVTQGAPVTKEALIPLIPFIIHFIIGMVSTTCMSLSLEGKNYWIMQSLPIKKETMLDGKMLFNLYLTVPFTLLGIISLSIACKAGFANTLMSLLCGIILCIFATVWGMRCNLKHLNFDWENEVEVIKQGTSVVVYIFPSMILTCILGAAVILLGKLLGTIAVLSIVSIITLLISGLLYLNVRHLARKL